jgi:hypothetical protein
VLPLFDPLLILSTIFIAKLRKERNWQYLCPDHYDQSKDWGVIMSILNWTFVSLYLVEMGVKFLCQGRRFFYSKWNIFDGVGKLIILIVFIDIHCCTLFSTTFSFSFSRSEMVELIFE